VAVRYLLRQSELAPCVGWDNDVWASLIMAFAGLARLGS
jgi:hypothetical protein